VGVRTEADKHKDKALASINEAIQHLSAIVIERVCGWDEYNAEYSVKLELALINLLDIRKGL